MSTKWWTRIESEAVAQSSMNHAYVTRFTYARETPKGVILRVVHMVEVGNYQGERKPVSETMIFIPDIHMSDLLPPKEQDE